LKHIIIIIGTSFPREPKVIIIITSSVSTNVHSRNVGTVLNTHDLIGDVVISARTSACDSRRSVDNEHFTAPASGGGIGLSAVAARIASTLRVQNVDMHSLPLGRSSSVLSFLDSSGYSAACDGDMRSVITSKVHC